MNAPRWSKQMMIIRNMCHIQPHRLTHCYPNRHIPRATANPHDVTMSVICTGPSLVTPAWRRHHFSSLPAVRFSRKVANKSPCTVCITSWSRRLRLRLRTLLVQRMWLDAWHINHLVPRLPLDKTSVNSSMCPRRMWTCSKYDQHES